jgi:uncharacterized protein YraI
VCLGPFCLFDPEAGVQNQRAAPGERALRVSPSVAEGVLNLRDGPGIGHAVLAAIPAGAPLSQVGACTKADDGVGRYKWCNVEWNGRVGWVSASGLDSVDGR